TLDDVTGVAGGGAPVSLGSRVDAFDPLDQNTYNHTTSSTVYDSLGNAHVMSMYFVKEPTVPGLASSPWSMYVQIDGRDVGNPNPLDPAKPPAPTRARFDLLFNADGSVNAADSEFTISNWQPLGPDGRPNGAAGPNNAGLI